MVFALLPQRRVAGAEVSPAAFLTAHPASPGHDGKELANGRFMSADPAARGDVDHIDSGTGAGAREGRDLEAATLGPAGSGRTLRHRSGESSLLPDWLLPIEQGDCCFDRLQLALELGNGPGSCSCSSAPEASDALGAAGVDQGHSYRVPSDTSSSFERALILSPATRRLQIARRNSLAYCLVLVAHDPTLITLARPMGNRGSSDLDSLSGWISSVKRSV